jgi:hypothetical protein
MSKRARFDGPHDDVFVFDPEASVEAPPIDHVKRGDLLSNDVPARIRDELLARDNWSEVNAKTEEKS